MGQESNINYKGAFTRLSALNALLAEIKMGDGMENRRKIGSIYEQIAAQALEDQGYVIVERNYRCTFGEVDLIARHDGFLVFVEVKYRKTEKYGLPVESVGYKKQKNISKVARQYIARKRFTKMPKVRFDIVGILGQEVTIYQNAFSYVE